MIYLVTQMHTGAYYYGSPDQWTENLSKAHIYPSESAAAETAAMMDAYPSPLRDHCTVFQPSALIKERIILAVDGYFVIPAESTNGPNEAILVYYQIHPNYWVVPGLYAHTFNVIDQSQTVQPNDYEAMLKQARINVERGRFLQP